MKTQKNDESRSINQHEPDAMEIAVEWDKKIETIL